MKKLLGGIITCITSYDVQTINDNWIPLYYDEFCVPPPTWYTRKSTENLIDAYECLDEWKETTPFKGRVRIIESKYYKIFGIIFHTKYSICKVVETN